MPKAPYGSWKSPITAETIVSSSIAIYQPAPAGEYLYWIEGRPTERGRSVIVRRKPDGSTEEVNAAPLNARTRVHEYGGGDYVVDGETVYFSNFTDQRIYVARPGAQPEPLTSSDVMRYADGVIDKTRNRLICVREDHHRGGEPANTIVAVDLRSGAETVLVEGHDFYANPRLSHDGSRLCWLGWDHPNMPWDGTRLYVAALDLTGRPQRNLHIAGGSSESVCQPRWSPDGSLYFVSDLHGWWNLFRWDSVAVQPLVVKPAEFAQPMWQLGGSTYDFDGAGRIVCTYGERGYWRLATIDTRSGQLTDLETPYSIIRELRVEEGRAYFIGGSPSAPTALVSMDLASGAVETIKKANELELDEGYVSAPEAIEFPTEGGVSAFGFFYPPCNEDFEPPEGLPPLLVMSHGGPTGATAAALSPRIQYWTSRGIAVLDVNYGGSTGYGRVYRERLHASWGIVDVDDCVNGARYLVEQGRVDGNRLAITGGSAGGFTTLAALTFRDVFKAGASHYGVGDLEALALETHKFESRYLDNLVGPYPEQRDLYVERSPIHHIDSLNCPVIFFQGMEDQIVPPNQAEAMVGALRSRGIPVAYFPFEGEQHGFRSADNIKRSLEAELLFYGRVFGFEPADDIEDFPIENL